MLLITNDAINSINRHKFNIVLGYVRFIGSTTWTLLRRSVTSDSELVRKLSSLSFLSLINANNNNYYFMPLS